MLASLNIATGARYDDLLWTIPFLSGLVLEHWILGVGRRWLIEDGKNEFNITVVMVHPISI